MLSGGLLGSAAACARPGGAGTGALPAAPAPAPTPTPALRAPLTYAALGASDAVGVGVENPARDAWVAVLGRSLPQPARVVNLGIPGIRLREALEVEVPPALDARPDLVTVWLVVNDILGGVAPEQYRADLDRLLSQLRSGTEAYVAVGNVPDAPPGSHYLGLGASERRQLTESWNAVIAGSTQAHGAVLVDLFNRWPVPEHPHYIGPDGLHPTVAGYRSLAEVFLQVLREQRII